MLPNFEHQFSSFICLCTAGYRQDSSGACNAIAKRQLVSPKAESEKDSTEFEETLRKIRFSSISNSIIILTGPTLQQRIEIFIFGIFMKAQQNNTTK